MFDTTSILFVFCLLLIVFFSIFVWIGKRSGRIGETKVRLVLQTLPRKQYFVLNDLLLPTPYGTTQIDHIIVSIYGVFVIETKDYRGVISGGEEAETWTKNVYGNKYSMPNPIRQNKVHVAAVAKILSQLGIGCHVRSIIAFSDAATLRIYTPSCCEIVYFSQLRSTISKYMDEEMSIEQVYAIIERIQLVNITDVEQRKQHVQNVRVSVKERQIKIANGVCPRCGGQIVQRTGKYGDFFGCSNYPKCRFVQRID